MAARPPWLTELCSAAPPPTPDLDALAVAPSAALLGGALGCVAGVVALLERICETVALAPPWAAGVDDVFALPLRLGS